MMPAPKRRPAARSTAADVPGVNSVKPSAQWIRFSLSSNVWAKASKGTTDGEAAEFHGTERPEASPVLNEGDDEMKNIAIYCLSLSLFFAWTGTAVGDAPEEVLDANGRVIAALDENGVGVEYIYDPQGNLREARYEDGRVEHFTSVPSDAD